MASIFVMGGKGYLGQCVVFLLREAGHNVQLCTSQLAELSPKSIQADYIVHMAAALRTRPNEIYTSNVEGTRHLLAAIDGCPKIAFVSSRAVYGEYCPVRFVDETAPIVPIDDYGRSKVIGEALITESGLSYIILRSSALVGYAINTAGLSFLTTMIDEAYTAHSITVLGGDQFVDPLYVWDLAHHIVGFCNDAGPWNEVFNVSGPAVRLKTIVSELCAVFEDLAGIRLAVKTRPIDHLLGIILRSDKLLRVSSYKSSKSLNEILRGLLQARLQGASSAKIGERNG